MDSPRIQCRKCSLEISNPNVSFTAQYREYKPVQCARCQMCFHASCTDIHLENIWCNLGVYQRFWKCYFCLSFPPTEQDKLMAKKIKQLYIGECCKGIYSRL